ncbi:MAG: FAD-dependent oxidoreductase, partial [Casimicrobiaceae bacterium]
MATVEVRVPDIGDLKDVPVIEVLVKAGDTVAPEDPLVTLESDKATMDVPSPVAGKVADVRVAAGDKVSQGSVILTLATAATGAAAAVAPTNDATPAKATPATPAKGAASPSTPAQAAKGASSSTPVQAATGASPSTPAQAAKGASGSAAAPAPAWTGRVDADCEMLVLGAGPGGYSAAFRAADLGMKTVLVERYAALGGVCLNVGCIPSKALLHTAAVMDEAKALGAHGIGYAAPQIDLDRLRGFKDGVVKKLTGGLGVMAKMRKVDVVRGIGRFLDPHHLEVELTSGSGQDATGQKKVIRFSRAIIAAGSQAAKLPFLPADPRIVDSTGALLLTSIPKRMLVIGGGIIGLEMATVYSTLGARVDIVEMLDVMMTGADRDLVRVWEKKNTGRFDKVMLGTRTVSAEATSAGIRVSFEGAKAPAEPQVYDLVLVAVGRVPNGRSIEATRAGVTVTERGFIQVDRQMRTNVGHIHAIGDIVGQPMLAHKAVH